MLSESWVLVPMQAGVSSRSFLEVGATPSVQRHQLKAHGASSYKELRGPVLAAGATAAMLLAQQMRKGRVARRFRDEERRTHSEAQLDWSALSESMSPQSQPSAEEEKQPTEITFKGRGFGSFQPVRTSVRSATSGKLNAELANGRLALLSAQQRATRVKALAAKTEEEEDIALQRKKFDLKQLPSDEGYGWDPSEVEAEKLFEPSEEVIGITDPLGYFDPLGFCKQGDFEGFRFKRAAELKHGRVAMLASVGLVTQHYVRLPGFDMAGTDWASQFNTIVTIPALYQFTVLLIVVLFLELSIWAQEEDREPGDFGDPLGLGMYSTEMRNRELNNGRFAMFATVGIIAAQNYSGKDAIEQLGL
mgnify:FL=1